LIPGGKIIDKKIGNSFHKLYINNSDKFNIISQQLSEIDNLIQAMEEPTRQYSLHRSGKENQRTLQFFWGYQAQVNQILRVLLMMSNQLIGTEKDSQAIYTRIVNLMLALERQFWHPDHRGLTEIFKYFHYEKEPVSQLRKMGVNAELVHNHKTVVKNFIDSMNQLFVK
jgi:hypothetical protein